MLDLISSWCWERGYVIIFTQDMLSGMLATHSTCD